MHCLDAVGSGHDGRRRIELVVAGSRYPRLAEPQQDPAVGAELDDLLPLGAALDPIGHPYVALAIDVQTVRKYEQFLAKALHQLAGGVKLENRRELRPVAVERNALFHLRRRDEPLCTTSLENPHALAVRIDIDARGRSPYAPVRQLGPVLDRTIRIGQRVRRRHCLVIGSGSRRGQQRREQERMNVVWT